MSLSVPSHESSIEWSCEPTIDGLRPDPLLAGWLTDRGLLTVRLRAACGTGFRLHLLESQMGAGVLLPHKRIRRVILSCGETPCVYAESHLPDSALSSIPKLRTLGADPLGEALQVRPDVVRGDFQFAVVDPNLLTSEVPGVGDRPLWARRSKFRVADSYLTVAEIFLPGIAER